MNHDPFIVPPNSLISLKNDYDPSYIAEFHEKKDAKKKLEAGIKELANYQNILYAQNTYALLIIFQAMDAAGKDSTIKHVMSGVNPQGCQVFSFKAPSDEDLDHDYLWRSTKALPERGRIGIFNRSYYEELLVVRVHPEILEKQQLHYFPQENKIWQQRFEEINNFEKYLVTNGILVLKFFLNVSKQEQKKRFLDRIETPEKHWKFSDSDVRERGFWDDYMTAYEQVFNHTSTEAAPWYIIPADHKWFTRLVVSEIICKKLQDLNLQYPTISEEHKEKLLQAKKMLESED
ncbi:polyphosphate kinase 2 family protein [Anabaena cylindrica FACHB-243]|uniref:Polyphosphate:AMP phosphotransferase n=1 Tax=Anabaena cylindrica (strain ATCC 27899 / PCC 7122) TaxID=272123 RepID=K9ZLX5_ANACC|nr:MULTISPECIES: polyphosphate kinase 2 family protein [Anabaena]AFZ59562.1 Polyphosphate:AMP phosphotransferase [Anabaena cylindrica PCC 7122]MBD2418772.1 polyphosphate kinase 2 family protein [Anabaena cylindrica FACHB-243]MBY5284758.1 polyphosphate kinase 2 family protein [Anabaena sp. CCAP 1446/1C]MBY5310175.1 polyphosphate kinase 2 family protein [Anabaena sp. CCAP 1446/1C]MCM2406337.1 polyphosphate kinase 2 family protein [Anabaena sp. CCAP 1446/1C]